MVRLTLSLLKRSVQPSSKAHMVYARNGKVKWRDYRTNYIEPPYWYKWSAESPYSPQEQTNILRNASEMKAWYKHNYKKFKVTEPHKWMIFVGDEVEILKGKDSGKIGKVTYIIPERNWVFIGGLNCKYESEMAGKIRRIEKPLDHDDVALIDPSDSKATEAEYRANELGKKVRVSKRTGYTIHMPPEVLWDGTPKNQYKLQDKDTSEEVVLHRSYKPTMQTFEEELNEHYGFKDPPRHKTYWY